MGEPPVTTAQFWVLVGAGLFVLVLIVAALQAQAIRLTTAVERLERKAHWTPPPVPAEVVTEPDVDVVDESPPIYLVTEPDAELEPGWIPAEPDPRDGDKFRL